MKIQGLKRKESMSTKKMFALGIVMSIVYSLWSYCFLCEALQALAKDFVGVGGGFQETLFKNVYLPYENQTLCFRLT